MEITLQRDSRCCNSIILLGISLFMLLTGRGKLSKNDEDAGGWTSVVGGAVFFISSMICIFG